MGRSIGGALVGLVSFAIIAGIFSVVLMFVLGADGLVDSDRNPSTIWLVSSLVLALGISYLGAAITRAVGKDKMAVYLFGGVVLAYTAYQLVMQGNAEQPEIDPNTPENMKAVMQAMFDAASNSPGWLSIASLALTVVGIALGGFQKGDFGKQPSQPIEPQ